MTGFVDVVVPSLGRDVEMILLVGWTAEEGARVAPGDPLFEVETDKAVFEVEAEAGGILCDVFVPAGTSVAPGAVLGRIRVE